MSIRLDIAQPEGCYLNPIFKFDLAARINTDVLQGLTGKIVVGTARLKRLEDLGLIDATRVVRVYRTAGSVSAQV